ncbi:substrate-binding domain-containing protein, partial [candidate division KSB1 bacterium]|nr:substrate-binding domain-containing protein [candidate division KSB1 bacterium]
EKLKPPLTTVRQNFSEMGRLTAQFLLQRLGKFTALPRKILPCELVIRESCGAARITQRRSSRPIKIGPVPPPTESATLADATSVKKSAAKIDTIGLMYRQFEDEIYPDIYYSKIRKGIEDTAGKKHYQILSSIPFKTKNEEYQAIRELLRRNIDGLIFVATHDLLPPAQEELVFIFRRRIPFIILAHCESAIMPYVTVDDCFGGYLAMEHLIAARRQVIGALLANPGDLISDLRNRGFHDAMLQSHFDPQNLHIFRNLIKPGQTQFEAAYLWAKELDLAAHPLQGLICLNDMLARGAIKALLERGLVIPEQIAVIGYDDSGIDGRDQIPLTTVQVPCYEIGRLGMQLLAEQIENQTRPERVQLKPALVIRQSG